MKISRTGRVAFTSQPARCVRHLKTSRCRWAGGHDRACRGNVPTDRASRRQGNRSSDRHYDTGRCSHPDKVQSRTGGTNHTVHGSRRGRIRRLLQQVESASGSIRQPMLPACSVQKRSCTYPSPFECDPCLAPSGLCPEQARSGAREIGLCGEPNKYDFAMPVSEIEIGRFVPTGGSSGDRRQ